MSAAELDGVMLPRYVAPVEQGLREEVAALRAALVDLDTAICAVRIYLSAETLQKVPERARARLDLALVHGRRARGR